MTRQPSQPARSEAERTAGDREAEVAIERYNRILEELGVRRGGEPIEPGEAP